MEGVLVHLLVGGGLWGLQRFKKINSKTVSKSHVNNNDSSDEEDNEDGIKWRVLHFQLLVGQIFLAVFF
jgi:hypothetical protein